MTEFRQIKVGEVSLRAVVKGEGPLVVLVHGFPDSWYSWRHLIDPIANAGFTACAFDVRGYGGSDKPHAIKAYGLEQLANDVAGLIKTLSPGQPAAVVGHDWGAPIAWTTALAHPDRVRAVAGLSVPYTGIPSCSASEIINELFTKKGKFFYMHAFAAERTAENELEADVRGSLRRFFYAWSADAAPGAWPDDKKVGDAIFFRVPDPAKLPNWLTEDDLNYYVNEFKNSGFRGPLNRYRNHDRDFHYLQAFKGKRIEQPALFIAGELDRVLTMFGDRLPAMRAELPNLQGLHLLPGCAHWTHHERPEAVEKHLLTWLRAL